jgi:hypothetical protein
MDVKALRAVELGDDQLQPVQRGNRHRERPGQDHPPGHRPAHAGQAAAQPGTGQTGGVCNSSVTVRESASPAKLSYG